MKVVTKCAGKEKNDDDNAGENQNIYTNRHSSGKNSGGDC